MATKYNHRNCHHCGFTAEQDPATKVWTCERLTCGRSWTTGATWQHYCAVCLRYIDLIHGCGCRVEAERRQAS